MGPGDEGTETTDVDVDVDVDVDAEAEPNYEGAEGDGGLYIGGLPMGDG
jgi:hypothetical protein